jgi:hypothetical protein
MSRKQFMQEGESKAFHTPEAETPHREKGTIDDMQSSNHECF